MKKVVALILSVLLVLNCYGFAYAAEIDGQYLGGIDDQTGDFLPDMEYVGTKPGARDPFGTEYLLVSMNATGVSNLLTTYNKLSTDYKCFRKSDISDDSYLYFVGQLTNTAGKDVRVGICYLNFLSGDFEKVIYDEFTSGKTETSGYYLASDLSSMLTYYGFITNYTNSGTVSGWLQVYALDPV